MKTDMFKIILLADGITCAAVATGGILMTGTLSELLGLSPTTAIAGGWICLATAILLFWLGTRERPPVLICWTVVLGNIGWVIASFAVLGAEAASLTGVGKFAVAAQALGVLGFAVLEALGTRALTPARSATA